MPTGEFAIEVNPAVLRWARTTAGRNVAEAARRIAVAEATLEGWETGRKSPSWRSLRKLAQYYQRPIAALLLPEPPSGPDAPPDFRSLARSQRDLSSASLLAIRTSRWLQGRAAEIRKALGIRQPQISKRRDAAVDHFEMARRERKKLGVDMAEQIEWSNAHEGFRHWKEELAEQGILVFQFRFPRSELQGFSLFDPICPVIVVNEEDAVEARIFTLFHEYCHLLLREPGMCLPRTVATPWDANIESFCNRFASTLLVPESVASSWTVNISADVREVDKELRRIARRYKVSKDVVLIKLRTSMRITDSEFRQVYERWNRERAAPMIDRADAPKPQRGGPSAIQKCRRQRGAAFVDLVLNAVDRDIITTRDALSYLELKIKDIDKLQSRK